MAERPELSPGTPNYYPWASDLINRPIRKKDGQVVLTDNKRPVLPEHTSYGLRYLEPPNFQELNYQFDGASQWIRHLDQRLSAGDVFTTRRVLTGADTMTQFNQRLGGEWESLGTVTVGSTVVEYFVKVA